MVKSSLVRPSSNALFSACFSALSRTMAFVCVVAMASLSNLAMHVSPALADSDSIGNPGKWLDELPLWPGRREVDRQYHANMSYRLVLSELKRQAATTIGEQERVIQGSVWRRVWEVSRRIDLDNLALQIREQMPEGELLYECGSLDCGSSHFWANEIFDNGRLVGRDRYQRYFVLSQRISAQRQRVFLMYATYRGSRQTVIGLNVIETGNALNKADVSRQAIEELLANNSGWLPGFVITDGGLDKEASETLLEAIKDLPRGLRTRLFLTVHCYEHTDMEANLQCSERLAEQLRVATYDGLTELPVRGLGALVLPENTQVEPALRFVFWPTRR